MPNRLISASAGTGKTHRLAIEYIAILLKNLHDPDFHFSRVLVITFTRKAAAEIRYKIFQMLDKIVLEKDPSILKQLEENLSITINDKMIESLRKIYINIKTNKDKIRISTIDSLINQVFKSMIAPIMKLTHYTIEESANYKVWEHIFEELMSEKNFYILKAINDLNPHKNIETLGNIFTQLIENRWIFDRTNGVPPLPRTGDFQSPPRTGDFQSPPLPPLPNFTTYCQNLHNLILTKSTDRPFHTYLTNTTAEIFEINKDQITEDNFLILCKTFIEKGIYKLSKQNINNLIKKDNIKLYDGRFIQKNPLGTIDDIKQEFLEFLYYEYVQKEYKHILDLWGIILKKYDRIKIKTGILSYSDISWYTYKFLYDPEYSMIDKNRLIVENIFYEFLAVRNQYLLIDEFQDTSLLQFLILAPMMNELSSGSSVYDDTSVIIVGDEKQSIYGWRGGVRELLKYMEVFINAKVETLTTCYRSTPDIVNYINFLFSEIATTKQNWYYPEGIISARKDDSGSVYNEFYSLNDNTKDDSYEAFVEMIKQLSSSKNLGDTAIIARTNSELENISNVLKNNNIQYVKESSLSIFQHKISQAILDMLTYIQFNDLNALLRFLKSDIMGLEENEYIACAEFISTNGVPPFMWRSEIADTVDGETPSVLWRSEIAATVDGETPSVLWRSEIAATGTPILTLTNKIITYYQIYEKFNNEIDHKNIQAFLDAISDFLNEPQKYTADLVGFLSYAKDEINKNNKKQQSIQDKNAITLLTIHKSKGLGFDTVFFYFDVIKKRKPVSSLEIEYMIDFSTFNNLSHVFLGWNYQSVLKGLFKEQFDEIENRNELEELNNIYVALTRAKTNLGVFFTYQEKIDTDSVKTKILKKALEYDKNNQFVDIYNSLLENSDNNDDLNNATFSDYFDIDKENLTRIPLNEKAEKPTITKYKLIGSATHTYLSYIKYNKIDEHKLAILQTRRLYGNILSNNEISVIIDTVNRFIADNKQYFTEDWDKIFNELTIFSPDNKMSRIDRLMINTKEKKILIIDYKTGKEKADIQLNYYKNVIKKLPVVKSEYNIDVVTESVRHLIP